MLLKILMKVTFLLALTTAAQAADICGDLFPPDGLLSSYDLSHASHPYGGNAIFTLGGRFSQNEIAAATDQLVSQLKDKFRNTPFDSSPGARNPRPKMPIPVTLPLTKLAQAKSFEDAQRIFDEAIKSAIFAELKTYDKAQDKPALIFAAKEVGKSTDPQVPHDLYEFLHSSTFELWSPMNVLSKFTFVFTNAQKVLTTLSTPDKSNQISPQLKIVVALLNNFMDPGIIPDKNTSYFHTGEYDNTVNSMASNYTIAMILSEQQMALFNYNVKDLDGTTIPHFLGKIELQGRPVKNPIRTRPN